MDDHNFVPLLEFGKRPECVRCRVTAAGNVKKEMPPEEEGGEVIHNSRDDYKYVAPILRKEVVDKEVGAPNNNYTVSENESNAICSNGY